MRYPSSHSTSSGSVSGPVSAPLMIAENMTIRRRESTLVRTPQSVIRRSPASRVIREYRRGEPSRLDPRASSRTASPQVLVRLHVEPHREQRELRAEDQEQGDEHHRRGGDLVAHDPQHDLRDPEPEAEDRHQHAEQVEEDERVEVADDVLLRQAPPEALEEQPRDRRDDLPQADPRALSHAVDR